MAVSKQKKGEVLEKLKKVFKESDSVAFVNFHGLKVSDAEALRRALRAAKVGYVVAKKTLTKKVLTEAGFQGEIPELQGELGIAYSNDLTAPAREVFGFQKKLENAISLQGGVFEKKFMNKEEITAIALIPSQQTLYAQFVNVINSPIQGLVMALDAVAKKRSS